MPETPDFEQSAAEMIAGLLLGGIIQIGPNADKPENDGAIMAWLRHIWNARGAADIAALHRVSTETTVHKMVGPLVENLDLALRGLDR